MDQSSRRLAALFVVGLMALFSPLLSMFNRSGSLMGLPILPLYLFTVWTVLVVVGWVLTRGEDP
jgi:hypothetical protein